MSDDPALDDAGLVPPTPLQGRVHLPAREASPWRRLGKRLLFAFAIFALTVAVVYVDRDGYRDANGDGLNLVDVVYYVTVTLSTTGYGDIAPMTDTARLMNAFVVTPARILFLVLLIGTTLEVLATQGREELRIATWRRRMKDHAIVVGYGITGRSAAETLLNTGWSRESVVVVDPEDSARQDALADGFAIVVGDATRRSVLTRAGIQDAARVIVSTTRDDTNILITLAIRQLNPTVFIAASSRNRDNVSLLRQSGADSVIVSADSAGRMLGTSAVSPHLGTVMEDLMTHGEGIEVAERDARPAEVGQHIASIADRVIGVVRDGELRYYSDIAVARIAAGDRLVVVRSARRGSHTPHVPPHVTPPREAR